MINYQYLSLFSLQNFVGMTREEKAVEVEQALADYQFYYYIGTLVSASLFFHICAKVVFNLTAEIKMVFDKWTMIDMVSCLSNIYSFNIIGNASVETFMDNEQKQILDYYVIAVTIFSWIRFFSYFLVIREISKLIMTLF